MLMETGKQVTSFFSEDITSMVDFSKYKGGKVLFIDFPKLFDLTVLSLTNENADELFTIVNEKTFSWLSGIINGLKQTRFESNVIKEPDNFFDLIILFYPGYNDNFALYDELYRVLKGGKTLLMMESNNPLEKIDHFAVEILLNDYWPIDYKIKQDIAYIENSLKKAFQNEEFESLSIKGLELRVFSKI